MSKYIFGDAVNQPGDIIAKGIKGGDKIEITHQGRSRDDAVYLGPYHDVNGKEIGFSISVPMVASENRQQFDIEWGRFDHIRKVVGELKLSEELTSREDCEKADLKPGDRLFLRIDGYKTNLGEFAGYIQGYGLWVNVPGRTVELRFGNNINYAELRKVISVPAVNAA